MNDDAIQDLKQFITTTVSQQTAGLATKDDINHLRDDLDHLKDDVSRLEQKIDDVQTAVQQAAISYTSEVDKQV